MERILISSNSTPFLQTRRRRGGGAEAVTLHREASLALVACLCPLRSKPSWATDEGDAHPPSLLTWYKHVNRMVGKCL